jgi:hypothetical protein
MTTEGARLARLGFADVAAAQSGLELLAGSDLPADLLADAIGTAADPDLALDGLVRVVQALPADEVPALRTALEALNDCIEVANTTWPLAARRADIAKGLVVLAQKGAPVLGDVEAAMEGVAVEIDLDRRARLVCAGAADAHDRPREQEHRQPVDGGQCRAGEHIGGPGADAGGDRPGLQAVLLPGVGDGAVHHRLLVVFLMMLSGALMMLPARPSSAQARGAAAAAAPVAPATTPAL